MERRTGSFLVMVGLLLVVAVGLFIAGPEKRSVAAAPAGTATRFVSVTGEAFLALKPDQVRLRLAVPAGGVVSDTALTPLEKIIAALRATGVSRDDIHAQAPELVPLGGNELGAGILDVVLRDPSRLTDVVTAVTQQGGRLMDARFAVAKPDQPQSQVLNLALKDALAKAKVLASAAGGAVGKVHTVKADRVTEEGAAALTFASAPPGQAAFQVVPGSSPYGYRSRVEVTYELR